MIEVRNLSKKYNDKTVVHDVSVKIKQGKITSFIGPNGAGKSTALSMITRLMKRDKIGRASCRERVYVLL